MIGMYNAVGLKWWGCPLWGKGSNLTGTDILDSQQQEPFPHQESRWRILELVFRGHANKHPQPGLILPHLTPWTTTSFFNIVPRWLPSFYAPVYGFRLSLLSLRMLVFPRVSSSNYPLIGWSLFGVPHSLSEFGLPLQWDNSSASWTQSQLIPPQTTFSSFYTYFKKKILVFLHCKGKQIYY